MTNRIAMTAQLASNTIRFGWYYAINQLVDARSSRSSKKTDYRPERPVPRREEIFQELRELLLADAAAAGAGLYPVMDNLPDDVITNIRRLQAMLADVPQAAKRRANRETDTAARAPAAQGLPTYFTQDFHYQTGGYLTDQSAELYDLQVETLFYGAANAMRRCALTPIANELRGRDQRSIQILDIACGTGRLLRQLRQAYPGARLTGVDLSAPYLEEAARHIQPLRPVTLTCANAEALPLGDASQDIVTCVFLFHELPPDVRRKVIKEIARVLKPEGLLVFIDSLQMGDRPGWDGLLEAFPVRFHEPYYRQYAIDDLDAAFTESGLSQEHTALAFLSKMMVRRRGRLQV